MANESGKRYSCKSCGAEFIVTTAGEGTMTCCGEPIPQK
ncbi:MAG: desulfoferrodoxin [Chloroflexota bacterium]|nr:desulfoferrodoxin [Chloroflexota bacterium]MDE2941489.1 desulfoferrodoxin [Chloroflexota bacterium]MDE3266867.1 desulfoferrodoxin [Chloroflexota bacterium]